MTDIDTILSKIRNTHTDILKHNLVGIYIHGSLAFNCFNWNKSDIDFIVVVNRPLELNVKFKLMKSIIELNNTAPSKGLEMSVVLKENCLNFRYPTPFELHFSNAHIKLYQNDPIDFCEKMKGNDIDLAAHFTVIKNNGFVLYGEPIDYVFGIVPKENYIDSIKSDITSAKEDIIESPIYIILNLCRVLAYVKSNRILSKESGGKWGMKNLDNEFYDIVCEALVCYKTDKIMHIDENKGSLFCEYMLNNIFE